MTTIQVRALYDFEAQPGVGELSISEGEILSISRQDVGDGWWEGVNQKGESGLFPESYVEVIESGPPSAPPPPLPPEYGVNAGWNNAAPHLQSVADDWDDEWDDDDSTTTETAVSHSYGIGSVAQNDTVSVKTYDGKTTVRKNFNRFSIFVKSGGESYILGQCQEVVPDMEKIRILEDKGDIIWEPNPHPYFCTVTSPKKESKLKGFKSFIAYQLSPSFSNIAVSRRYKHFDWLHERLEEKFASIPIPPLPDKQVTGRYEDSFIEHRMAMLQSWVDRLCRHPVLSRCSVWQHFVNCNDERAWKTGKRKSERDDFIGAKFFLTIVTPDHPLPHVENETESFNRFATKMEHVVKESYNTCVGQVKLNQGAHKRNCLKIGKMFHDIGVAFEMDPNPRNERLKSALKNTGDTYNNIGKIYMEQPHYDWERMSDTLHEYKGMLTSFPEILTVHKGALDKRREIEKRGNEGRMDSNEVIEVCRRTDVVSYATLAEMSHFKSEQVIDFNDMMHNFLSQQIAFYTKIVNQLQQSLAFYDPPSK